MHNALLADVGVPMIFVEWPLMLCALVPVIAIEAEVARRQLTLPYRKAFAGAAKANLLSTLVGVPLAWAIMLAVEFATLYPTIMAAERWHWRPRVPCLLRLLYPRHCLDRAGGKVRVADCPRSGAAARSYFFRVCLA